MSNIREKLTVELTGAFLDNAAGEDGWLHKFQAESKRRFSKIGVPLQSDEEWRLSNPQVFINTRTNSIDEKQKKSTSPFDEEDKIVLVFIDGTFSQKESNFSPSEAIDLMPLNEINRLESHWCKDLFGKLEEESQKISTRPLAIFNSAYAKSGILINVKEDVELPIEFKYITRGSEPKCLVRNFLKLSPGKKITVIEHFEGNGWSNILTEMYLQEESTLNHFRFKNLQKDGTSNTFVIAKLQKKSSFQSNSLSVGLGNNRNECHVMLNGEFSSAAISGASFLGNGETLDDDVTSIHHVKPDCTSRQIFKKVQGAGSIGVFQGKIRVEKEAQKTDGYQTSRAILLEESSKFLAKPELEIFADDVSCSHGSVSGSIDWESLFYLQSRGIPEEKAKNMLVLAFLNEVFEEIEDEKIKKSIKNYMEKYLTL